MNEMTIFENTEFGTVRTMEIDGRTYFVANDVAKALGYKRPNDAITAHCRGAVKRRIGVQTGIKGNGVPALQEIDMLIIPEGDIYRLVVKSQLPSAEKFERWVFDDVLPSIRKNGGYIAGQETLSDEELLSKALMVAQKKIDEKNKLIATQDSRIQELRPKEIFADAVSASHTSILIGDLAKLLKQNGVDIGQKRLFAWMRDNGYLIRRQGSDWNMPTQRSMEMGLFEVKESTVNNPDGSVRINRTTKVTGKGQQYFINKFLGEVA